MGSLGVQTHSSKYKAIEKCPHCGGRDYLKSSGLCEQCHQTYRTAKAIKNRKEKTNAI
jgi:uncharacterized protein (DUF983 family)